MRKLLNLALPALLLVGCSPAQNAAVVADMSTPAGQLFCAIQGASGTVVAGLIDASAVVAGAPVAIIATGALKAQVDADCAAAGGVAVSPPASPATAPQVAVVVPVLPTPVAAPVAAVPVAAPAK